MKENILGIIAIVIMTIIMAAMILSSLFMVSGLLFNILRVSYVIGLVVVWAILRKVL